MRVTVKWLREHEEETFGDSEELARVLYSYSHPRTNEILYLGKADYCTVGERLRGRHKEVLFSRIAADEKVSQLLLRVGVLRVEQGRRYSSALLSDVESLLIYALQPRYNKQSRLSRISRPGLHVQCQGDWHSEYQNFIER